MIRTVEFSAIDRQALEGNHEKESRREEEEEEEEEVDILMLRMNSSAPLTRFGRASDTRALLLHSLPGQTLTGTFLYLGYELVNGRINDIPRGTSH